MQGKNCRSPEKERKQEKIEVRSLSLFQSFAGMAITTCCKDQKIEGMCTGSGWEWTNILILSCNTLVSWAKYRDALNLNSPIP